jgi:phage replication O-like protein O
MIREQYTPTPNILFDELLRELNNSELKILLVIIRQTNGWIDKKTTKRKKKDRITHNQFIKKTGLSRRIISYAIKSLSDMRLIKITDNSGNALDCASERKGKYSIYYSSLLENTLQIQTCANSDTDLCKNRHQPVQKVIHNKRNYNKRKLSKERNPDYVHVKDVIEEIKTKWNPEIKV